ncbi:MAG TPA: sialate O-acetylesterase [Armatimonadota bacterium]
MQLRTLAIFLLWLIAVTFAGATVKLPALFSDNMVLQRDANVAVWGWAAPGEKVTISVQGQQVGATADAQGNWRVALKPMPAGGPVELTVAGADKTITLHNVLLGDVWVCSGQSNMNMYLQGTTGWEAEAAQANYPNIRLCTQTAVCALEPRQDVQVTTAWTPCSPEKARYFSAVAYYFGKELHSNLNVPIGLLANPLNGSTAEAWSSRATLAADPELKVTLDYWDTVLQKQAGAMLTDTYPAMQAWVKEAEQAKAEGKPLPIPPAQAFQLDPRTNGNVNYHLATGLFLGTILPITPLAIKGVIWYQGEHNTDRPAQYRKLLPALITCWRQAWGRDDLPFLFVQLPNYYARQADPNNYSGWTLLREAQTQTLRLPHTGMAVSLDVGEAGNIHPVNKGPVGKRLGLVALATVYGKTLECSGPVYDGMTVEGQTIRLRFTHLGGGLVAKDGEALTGFAIAGNDKKFTWADARIDGDTIVVSCKDITEPVAVRYAWADNPQCNLYNTAGLPTGTFRTDNW